MEATVERCWKKTNAVLVMSTIELFFECKSLHTSLRASQKYWHPSQKRAAHFKLITGYCIALVQHVAY